MWLSMSKHHWSYLKVASDTDHSVVMAGWERVALEEGIEGMVVMENE